MESEKSSEGIKLYLYVEHGDGCPEMDQSIYMIEPPADLAEYEKEIDSEGFMSESISPLISLKKGDKDCFLTGSAMFRLNSRIYFFGGGYISSIGDYVYGIPAESKLTVRVYDMDCPDKGLFCVAPLNAPKITPCVFSFDGKIYVLGSANEAEGASTGTFFERYDPAADEWELFPDPPLPFARLLNSIWFDCATMVRDRYVFVGNSFMSMVFYLDTLKWESLMHSPYLYFFPYGSVCVDGSLYYLRGLRSWKVETDNDCDIWDPVVVDKIELELVKRGPLADVNDPFKVLEQSRCLEFRQEQVIATDKELDDDTLLSHISPCPWREIFHLGDRFFCYVVTGQLVYGNKHMVDQPYCRGVWIKVFEEVPPNSTHKAYFRTLASFCYRIRTDFPNEGYFIRCCAFGSVPQSWVDAPLKKKLVVTKESKVLKAEQSQHEHGGGSKGLNLEKSLSAIEEENIRLKDELARMAELLKAYEAKSEGKLVHSE